MRCSILFTCTCELSDALPQVTWVEPENDATAKVGAGSWRRSWDAKDRIQHAGLGGGALQEDFSRLMSGHEVASKDREQSGEHISMQLIHRCRLEVLWAGQIAHISARKQMLTASL